ncbi:MAG: NUDIX hydrolase [Candidatus Gastranaerophilales bacterium]|nr:NUDIX hydrolase [Candidatus Gastranaerophilales bacterium]
MTTFNEKTLSEKMVFDGKFIKVAKYDVEISTGQKRIREVVHHPGGVVVVAQKDENTILMVKQYRYPIKQVSLELPAGRLEPNDNPDERIKKELEEETGYIAETWKSLGYIYTTPGICDEKLYLYYATKLTFKKQNPEEGEIIEYFEYNIDKVFELIKTGEINDAKTICALTRAFKL